MSIWRYPAVESHEYPGLCLHDMRVTGSITAGCSRLPLWAFTWTAVTQGWEAVEAGWAPTYGWNAEKMGEFLYNLLEQRGEFGRLLLILADVERRERHDKFWDEMPTLRKRVLRQLQRCTEALEPSAGNKERGA